jgi:hypothetical protein
MSDAQVHNISAKVVFIGSAGNPLSSRDYFAYENISILYIHVNNCYHAVYAVFLFQLLMWLLLQECLFSFPESVDIFGKEDFKIILSIFAINIYKD